MTHHADKNTCKETAREPKRAKGSIPVIGLAGGIGSGKTLVAGQLAEMGCAVIDVDQLAKELRDLPKTLRALNRSLGDQIFTEDGRIDEKALAELVFSGAEQVRGDTLLSRLNAIIHPLVAAKCRELIEQSRLQQDHLAVVLDAPLLFEAHLDRCCDVIIFIQSKPELRSRRVRTDRGWTKKQWSQREKAQILLDKKADLSDYIVENNSSKTDLRCHIQRLFPRILGKAGGVQRKAWPSEALSER